MKFHEMLKANRGGLFIMRSEIFWFRGGWDGSVDRPFVLLGAQSGYAKDKVTGIAHIADGTYSYNCATIEALLDGKVQVIKVAPGDLEVISETG